MTTLIPEYQAQGVVYDAPALLPEHLEAPEVFTFSFSSDVRKAWRMRAKQPTREWAERHRYVPTGSRPGFWKNANAPYAAGIFDAWDRSHVRMMALCFAPQCAKTAIEMTCLASAIDQDPGPAMVIMDTDDNAGDLSKDQLLPMLRKSPRLAQYLSSEDDKTSTYRVDLVHMTIHVAYATSINKLASKSIRYMIWDEIDKHAKAPSKKEADAISLGRKRQRTFLHNRKEIFASSPSIESGPIWRILNQECQVVFHFWARCPECGGYQRLWFKESVDGEEVCRLRWPEGERDPLRIETEGLAWYECAHCGGRWDDYKRDRAVAMGEWRTDGGLPMSAFLAARRPQKVGFHLSALYSAFVPLSEIAAAFLTAERELKKGKKEPLKDFMNGYLAEPWVDYQVERAEDRILALRDDRPRMLVPSEALGLTMQIDTQDTYWMYTVRAWGEGFRSWLVREGRAETEEQLEDILVRTQYLDALGRSYVVNLAGADTQGHRTRLMYDFCRRNRVLAIKGEQTMKSAYSVGKIDTYPGTNIPIPGGLKLFHVNSKYYKDWLAGLLEIKPADPGAFLLHSEAGADYARQMCVEYTDDKGLWQCPDGKANHYWDCEYMGLFLAELAGIGHWGEAKRAEEPAEGAEPPAQRDRESRGRPGWFSRR